MSFEQLQKLPGMAALTGRMYANGTSAPTTILDNLTATTDPAGGNDSTQGYTPGSLWVNITLNRFWVCFSNGVGTALWQQPSGFSVIPVWMTGTVYTVGQDVYYADNSIYRCSIAHTSGTFATDLAAGRWTQISIATAANSLVYTAGAVQLVGDVLAPGNAYYYGTNGSGTKGFFTFPTAASVTVVGGNLQLIGDSATPGNNYIYGTDSSGTKGFRVLPTVESITLNGSGQLHLSGDTAAPGNTFYYGTNAGGSKGWYALTLTTQQMQRQFFTASGTFTVPTGVTRVLVECLAGGGGGGGGGVSGGAGGGGSGGFGKSLVTVTPAGTVTVTVGAGGTAGNSGGTSSFGASISCTGGAAGTGGSTVAVLGGAGGTSSSADLNISGQPGESGLAATGANVSGKGGNSQYGAGGAAALASGTGGNGSGYGAGGGGAGSSGSGGNGSGGLVAVYWTA